MLLKQILIQHTLQAVSLATIIVGLSCCSNNPTSKNSASTQVGISDTAGKNIDAQFINKAADINLEEIKLGQLAQQNGSMQCIRDLGKMIETDHAKSWNELIELGKQKSITIPSSMSDNAKSDYEKLSSISGSDFDKQFSDMMVKGHKEAIKLFENDSARGNDVNIRNWAAVTLPALRAHLKLAMQCSEDCRK